MTLPLHFAPDTKAAKESALKRRDIIEAVARNGFTVRIDSPEHIKIYQSRLHIDIMPSWFENDFLNIGGYSSLRIPPEELESVNVSLAGEDVLAFRGAEIFLEKQYGPSWRTPDPTWRFKLSERILTNREDLRPSVEEVKRFGYKGLKLKYGIIKEKL